VEWHKRGMYKYEGTENFAKSFCRYRSKVCPLRRPRRRWEENVKKWCLVWNEEAERTDVVQSTGVAFANNVMNLRFLKKNELRKCSYIESFGSISSAPDLRSGSARFESRS